MKQKQTLKKWTATWALIVTGIMPGMVSGQNFNPNNADCGGMFYTGGNQRTTSTSCTNSSPAYTSRYSLQSTYVPNANDPVITVKITFHIFNKSNGTGSFQNTPSGVSDLQQMAAWIHNGNDRYSNPRSANYWPAGFVSPYNQDSKVNYELTNIYFYNDDVLNTVAGNDQALFNKITSVDPKRLDEGLPIIFNNGSYVGAAGYAAGFGSGYYPYVHTFCTAPPMGLWWLANSHLLHELGHCMGWYHTYQGGGDEAANGFACPSPNFLSDVFPINNGCTNQMGCGACFEGGTSGLTSNDVMSGNADNSWMSPLRQGRRIMNLHLSPARHFAKEMVSGALNPWLITSNETWDFDIQMYKDIVVKSGSTLTIKCNVAMADNGRIIVERGAKLIIDGGTIRAWGSSWSGIQVWGTSTANQTVVNGLSPNHGIVQVINQGTLQDAGNAISTGKWDENGNIDWGGYSGGIIQCDGGRFINNQRAIQYMSYHNFNAVTHNTIDNIGYVKNSVFETNAILKDPTAPYPQVFVSMWDVQGVKYLGNTYQNTVSPAPSTDHLGSGFYSIDASYTVDRYQVCTLVNTITGACAHYSYNNVSAFNNLQYGVQVQNGTPLTNIIVNNNDFTGCNRAVYIGGAYNTKVTNNRINVGNGQNTLALLPYGIYFENSSAYDISNNTIWSTQWTDYNFSLGTGICISGSNGLNNTIYRNNVNMMGSAASVYGDNQGTNPGDGLKFKCNMFGQGVNGKNYIDLNMMFSTNYSWQNGKIDKYQGSATAGANNYFSHANNANSNIKSDYSDNAYTGTPMAAGTIHYFYNNGNTNLQPYYYDASMTIQSVGTAFNAASMCPQTPGGGGSIATGRMNTHNGETVYSVSEAQELIAANTASITVLMDRINAGHLSSVDELKLYSQVADLNQQKGFAIDVALGSMLSDTLGWNSDAIIGLMKIDNRANADIRLLSAYIALGKSREANAQIEVIRKNKGESFALFCDEQKAIINLKQQPAGIYALKSQSEAKELLHKVGRNEQEPGYVYAKAILKAVLAEEHQEAITLPNGEGFSSRQNAQTSALEAVDHMFSVYPNPAAGSVNVAFMAQNKYSSAEITVFDVTGHLVLKQAVPEGAHALVLPTEGMKPGLYLVSLILDGVVKEKQKIIKE